MSTDEYVLDDEDWVPTEEEVRHFSRAWLTESDFDRFLARVRRDAKAEAWQEGVNFALPGKETHWISKHNPHRATETGGSDEHR